MNDSQTGYRSFVLRLWCENESNDHRTLRIILVDPHTDQRWGFTDFVQLTTFLQEQAVNVCTDTKE